MEKTNKKVVVPKSVENVSEIVQELISGAFSESEVGRVVSPSELRDEIKKNGGSTHTTTVQNIAGVLAVGNYLREHGWEVIENKEGYFSFHKSRKGNTTPEKLHKELTDIKKLIKGLVK